MQRSLKKAFLKAVEGSDLRRLRNLLDQGADPNFQSSFGETPLTVAIHRGQIESAILLLDAGANVRIQSRDGATALFWAARYGQLEIVERLLAAGADVHAAREHRGNTPLARAVSDGHAAVAQKLIEHGADPDQSYLGEKLTCFAKDDEMRRILLRRSRRAN
jgi:ankyrin repeat protein